MKNYYFYLEHTTAMHLLFFMIYYHFSKLIEYDVIRFMRQFENNKLQDGFKNEWSLRLVEGGNGYMLRNLNDLHVQRAIHLKVDKMSYFSRCYLWKEGNTLPVII